ncbi:riboflavin synthase subunit alpha [Neptunomonas phycophila]|uniref:Riboflavin synthase n=1 Tax=Neptunomonas phycophila TaxID=1572645 RepID=A0ABT9EU25_9GAMM|nr:MULTISPECIES: riboflavin synthase subunit alpha [Neptunomonas]MDN2658707.1 riboflavin synthase subunit alpha [Neptunomonas sp. CHC150]MDP2522575.1 riboflavin synthase subunit alpha [Neptunomonas phycophila]
MFTGIVQGQAEVIALERRDQFMKLRVALPAGHTNNLQTGASIAINGTCLTVTSFDESSVQFDLIQETLNVTNLGELRVTSVVNFERAAKFGDEIGGHLLSGHISATAQICEIKQTDDNCIIWFEIDEALTPYILTKGFVALNGCSLTIGAVEGNRFNVYLIPETLSITTFGQANVGDRINIEVDPQTQAIVDTVNRYLETHSPVK